MSQYSQINHHGKSLKRLNQTLTSKPNSKISSNQPSHNNPPINKTSSYVNLSRLGTSKGKFSLTNRYNSLANNSKPHNPSQYQSKQNDFENNYRSELQNKYESNKENLGLRENLNNNWGNVDNDWERQGFQKDCYLAQFPVVNSNSLFGKQNVERNLFGKENLNRNLFEGDNRLSLQQNNNNNRLSSICTAVQWDDSADQANEIEQIHQIAANAFDLQHNHMKYPQSSAKILSKSSALTKPPKSTNNQTKQQKVIDTSKQLRVNKNERRVQNQCRQNKKQCLYVDNKEKMNERRSKFHKYDNILEENEFLVVEEGNGEIMRLSGKKKCKQIGSDDIKQQMSNKENTKQSKKSIPFIQGKPQKHVLQAQLLQKAQLNQQLQEQINSITQSLQTTCNQLISSQQSIRQITFSMIRMISIMDKWQKQSRINKNTQTKENRRVNQDRNYMTMIRDQIYGIYSKELAKYVDKLGIREELMERALKQVKQQSINIEEQSGFSASHQHTVSHQSHITYSNQRSVQCDDSILQQYQIHQQSHIKGYRNHNHNQITSYSKESTYILPHDKDQEDDQFFDFNKINQLGVELLHSGRNLLDTFNNQNLGNQLRDINTQFQNEEEEEEQEEIYQKQQMRQLADESGYKHEQNQGGNLCTDSKVYQKNLQYAINQLDADITSNNQDSVNICRKLFRDQPTPNKINPSLSSQKSSLPLSKQSSTPLSKQSSLPLSKQSSTPLPLSQSQSQQTNYHLQPQHYYQVITAVTCPVSSNYLSLQVRQRVKLLRRVNEERWIAECQDKIGFVEENRILGNIKMLQPATSKKQSQIKKQIS